MNGAVPISVDSLDGLLAHLTALIALDDLRQAWGERVSVPPGSLVVARAVLLEVKERLDPILGLENWRIAARAAVADVDEVPAPRWSDVAQVRRLEQVAGAVDAVLRCHDADAGIAALAADLESQAGVPKAAPEVALLADAARSRDVAAYTDAYSALEEVRTLGAQLARRDRLFDRVAAAAPQLAGAVRADPDADDWQAWLAGFQAAWDHARATACVRRELDGGDAAALDTQLGRLDVRLRQYRGQLGATLAWRATLSRLTQHNKTHLTAYRLWMKRYGKGTGKHAPYYLAQARLSMNECIDAVPAWIMPTYRLAETITAKFEPFDLAIVDEASQSGVESLFVWALARQVVIVGDDQQISPEAVGIDLGVVRTLQEQLIPDIPQKGLFTPTASIFDQAQLRYPGKLQLREHFRCMPEIIAFSNALCYASSPLGGWCFSRAGETSGRHPRPAPPAT